MEETDRRNFLKKSAILGAAALVTPSLLKNSGSSIRAADNAAIPQDIEGLGPLEGTGSLIVPHGNALKITGTFLDEISHDIPHQNWGIKEWDRDFRYMKDIGIDTVIEIRSGYRKFITWPSPYLLGKGCYMPSVDLVDMFLFLAERYGM